MVRLGLVLTLLATPVLADCFDFATPNVVHFNAGPDVVIRSATARDITYSTQMPDGAQATTTLRFGLFPIARTDHGVTLRYDWQSDLPNPRKMTAGSPVTLDADVSVEHATRQHFQMVVQLLRDDVITLNDCPYKVRVIATTERLNGQITGQRTEWLSPDLMIPLRSDVIKPSPATILVTGLE